MEPEEGSGSKSLVCNPEIPSLAPSVIIKYTVQKYTFVYKKKKVE